MSALNVINTRDGIHFFADTAGYDMAGCIVGFGSKIQIIPGASAVIAGIGVGAVLKNLFAALSGARSLAEIVSAIPARLADAAADIDPNLPGRMEVYAAGYVSGVPHVFAIKTADARVSTLATMTRVPPKTCCFHPMAQQDGFAALGQKAVAVLEGMNRLGEQLPLTMLPEYARLVLNAQRHSRNGLGELNDGAGAYVVGGAAELVSLLPGGAIMARCLHQWPDELGRPIIPSTAKDEAAA